MKKLIFLFILILGGCAGHNQNVEVLNNTSMAEGQFVRVAYHPKKVLIEASSKDNHDKIPEGGIIVIRFSTPEKEATNTVYWEFLLVDKTGADIQRYKGVNSQALFINDEWNNVGVILVEKPITVPTMFYVFNLLTGTRHDFVLYPEAL